MSIPTVRYHCKDPKCRKESISIRTRIKYRTLSSEIKLLIIIFSFMEASISAGIQTNLTAQGLDSHHHLLRSQKTYLSSKVICSETKVLMPSLLPCKETSKFKKIYCSDAHHSRGESRHTGLAVS